MRPGGVCPEDRIEIVLTDPAGNKTEISPDDVDENLYNITSYANSSGAYSLTAVSESTYAQDDNDRNHEAAQKKSSGNKRNVNCLMISSACFLAVDYEVAIPKVPDTRMVFVTEKWELPGFYKLISLFI